MGVGWGKVQEKHVQLYLFLEFVFSLSFAVMNPKTLLDSTRNALVYFFQSLFPRKLLGFVCYVYCDVLFR